MIIMKNGLLNISTGILRGDFSAALSLSLFILAMAFSLAVFPAVVSAQVNFPPGEIYFSPDTKLEDKFVSFLSRAEGAIFMCASALDSQKITDALIDAKTRRMLPVKVLIYKPGAANNLLVDKLMTYRIEVVLAENSAGFDMNFCIVDYNSVYFSSAPFTYTSMNQNYNYAMIISHDENFAKNFHYEFIEMFEGHYFGTASPQNTQFPTINFNGTIVETAFLPEDNADNKIVSMITKANSSIRVMSSELKNALLNDNILGKKNYLFEQSNIFEYGDRNISKTEYETYRRSGVYTIQNKTFPKIETSFMIVDEKYLLLMGGNKSKSNTTTADSFLLTINSPQVISAFRSFYDSIWLKNTSGIFMTGQVLNASNKLPLEGARISCTTQQLEAYSDYLGWYEFKGDMPDEFLVEAEREYYFSKEFIFSKKSGVRLDFLLSSIISYNSLSGYLIDTYTRKPISGCGLVAVNIDTTTGVRTRVRTNSNEKGFFTFKALPLGKVDIEITHPNYVSRIEKAVTITAGQAISLQSPLELKPSYIITAYPNPIFEDNLFINIKDSIISAEVPAVTIKQNNYVEVPVSLKIAASADATNVYVGAYVIKKGYYGTARINVNGGTSYKDITIDFLEAYKNYTFAAPADSDLAGTSVGFSAGAVGKSGYIAIQRSAEKTGYSAELFPVGEAGPVSIDFSRNFSIVKGAAGYIEIPVTSKDFQYACSRGKGGRPAIFSFNEKTGGWDYLETATDERELPSGSREVVLRSLVSGGGLYRVFTDVSAPKVESRELAGQKLTIKISDHGSGLSENGAAIVCEKALGSGDFIKFTGISGDGTAVYSISAVEELAKNGARLVLNDRSGNYSDIPFSSVLRQAAVAVARRVTVYPNPCKSYAKFRITAPAGDSVTITVYDSSGDKVFDVCEDFMTSGAVDEVTFNAAGPSLKKGNSTLLYRAKFSSGSECNGKLSILN